MPGKKVILVCPLDWGLGHASRVIPVISRYLTGGDQVIIGGSGKSGELLQKTFPQLVFLTFPGYEIKYPANGAWLILSLILQLPRMVIALIRENNLLNNIVRHYGIDTVISDNRYGLHSGFSHNIIITHQISPILPVLLKWAEYPLYLIMRYLIQRFDECWIPDSAGKDNMTGKLTHRFKLPRNARFIGILSRFTNITKPPLNPMNCNFKMVIVLSGPQPSLRHFTYQIFNQAKQLPFKVLIIGGLQHSEFPGIHLTETDITYFPHLETDDFMEALLNAEIIVCRAGYSGIMDLLALNKSAILVPTPGQTEQIYLAGFLDEKGLFRQVRQSDLKLDQLSKHIASESPEQEYNDHNRKTQ
jgi:hypothetical protein